jgi:hypothetical protein
LCSEISTNNAITLKGKFISKYIAMVNNGMIDAVFGVSTWFSSYVCTFEMRITKIRGKISENNINIIPVKRMLNSNSSKTP